MMQQTLRPYLTTGVAVVGAGLIALVPAAPQVPDIHPGTQHRAVTLAADPSDIFEPYNELYTNTVNNLQALGAQTGFSDLLTQIFTNPTESFSHIPDVVSLLTNVVPDINFSLLPLPVSLSIELPPLLSLGLAALGPFILLFDAFQQISDLFASNPIAAIIDAPAILLNAFLNGQQSSDILGAGLSIFNGLLVPTQNFDFQLGVGQVVDNLGLGDQSITDLLGQFGIGSQSLGGLLTGVLDAAGVGHQTPVDLLDQAGIGDQTIASVATQLLDAMGFGNPSITDIADQLGVGNQSIASLAIQLLGAAGIDNPSITDLADQAGVSTEPVSQLLINLLDSAGVGDPTLTELLSQAGLGDITVSGVVTQLLGDPTLTELVSQFAGLDGLTLADLVPQLLGDMGQGNLSDLLDTFLPTLFPGTSSATQLGDFLIDVLQNSVNPTPPPSDFDFTLTQLLDFQGVNPDTGVTEPIGDWTIGNLLHNTAIGNEPFTDLLGSQGQETFGELGNISSAECAAISTAIFFGANLPACGDTLDSAMGNRSLYETLEHLHHGSSGNLGDKTLFEVINATGQQNEHLSDIITNLNLNTTLGQIVTNLGLNDDSLNDIVINAFGLDNVTVTSLLDELGFSDVDLSTVLTRLGLDNVSILSLLGDLGFNNLDVDTVITRLFDSLLGNPTVGDILDDLNLDNAHLDDVINALLGNVTLDSVLSDLGLNDVHVDSVINDLLGDVTVGQVLTDLGFNSTDLDTIVDNLGLNDITVDDLLSNLGLNVETVDEFLSNLGLMDNQLLDVTAGDFFGFLPGLSNIAEQIAEAFGAPVP